MTTAIEQIDKWNSWQEIDWKVVEREVFKLQKRIYKASQSGDAKKVHKLQKLMTHSYYGKLLSTRRVTQDNRGKRTAGTDGIKNLSPQKRFELAKSLKLGKKVKPTRRVWIPKPGKNEKRPLGIPTMYERALQGLIKAAIEPEWEARFEINSYGFRPGRGCHDAIEAIYNSINKKSKYVLDADIASCFDKINHSKLLGKLNTYPTLRRQVKAWLKSGVMDNLQFSHTSEGVPQGGVLSPLLANIALHGMEKEIENYAVKQPWRDKNGEMLSKKAKIFSLTFVRYADDFVILHKDLKTILDCKKIISKWLSNIGLELKESKTKISHTLENYQGNIGFDFLGFHIRQYPTGKDHCGRLRLGYKTIIKPTKEKVKAQIKKCGDIIRKNRSASQLELISKLNPIIRGYSNYYKTACSKIAFNDIDEAVLKQLWSWARRRHGNKSKSWIKNKYWKTMGNSTWNFTAETQDGKETKRVKLLTHFETEIIRHTKVKGNKSPYDGNMTYWASRLGKHPDISTSTAKLLKKQKGKCRRCNLYFKDEDLMETDHIKPLSQGGKRAYSNIQLLHQHCHFKKSMEDRQTCTNDNGVIGEKPYEEKFSSTVLKTSHLGDEVT